MFKLRRCLPCRPALFIALAIMLIDGLTPAAWAWSELGHMVVAQIAYSRLTPKTKAAVDRLIAIPIDPLSDMARTHTFITAACWADDVRNAKGTGEWHYIDLPLSLDGTQPKLAPAKSDVVEALAIAKKNLLDPQTSDSQKAESLRYMIHFVGDIHQPLHCVTGVTAARPGGDRGGNSFVVRDFSTAHNLHAVWDSGVGLFGANFVTDRVSRPLDDSGTSKVLTLAHEYTELNPPSLIKGKSMDPREWAQEGYELSKTIVYPGITDGGAPSKEYIDKAQPVVKQRIAIAGYRLADMLNQIFDPTAADPKAAAAYTTGVSAASAAAGF